MPKRKRATKGAEVEKQEPQPEAAKDADTNISPCDPETDIAHFEVPFNDKSIICERHQPPKASHDENPPALVFTHGAGGGITAAATQDFAKGFGDVDRVVCFQGTMNLTNRVKAFKTVVGEVGGKVLGGRSMGARAAVLTALELVEAGNAPEALILVSWPLTAGKEGKREPERREKILHDIPEGVDVLFILGERDVQCEMGLFEEVQKGMKARTWVCVVKGADHGMGLREKRGVEAVRRWTGRVAAEWVKRRDEGKKRFEVGWNREKGEVEWSGWKESE